MEAKAASPYSKKVQEFITCFPNAKKTQNDPETYEIAVMIKSSKLYLKVAFPSNFPNVVPKVKILALVQHQMVAPDMRLAHPKLVLWKSSYSVGPIIQDVIRAFQDKPPKPMNETQYTSYLLEAIRILETKFRSADEYKFVLNAQEKEMELLRSQLRKLQKMQAKNKDVNTLTLDEIDERMIQLQLRRKNLLHEQRSQDEKEKLFCVMCLENEKNTVFQPCSHMCTCYECACKLKLSSKDCPVCRQPIKSCMKVFT
mmetsp:Transcript_5331/g.5883  ORF Transcript_5331/g.5883 Transcript_5331/m.5883 type:complete len:256 (-) Transcript_5331:195-962(-)|eukprot:CAMPEP_0114987464 /NCGR_PEP_ID=MMETSP0216-20121206/9023_1 /TAXON_ID=223996 /ORGANISM="Protocruzia adherens, Strain Boccale" /LENGTH=255 /DNA_ID=CAMNT_0002350067 /DNA_START=1236 /DNA_END=2006 /DNA_ORIENTATION=-